MIPRKLEEIVKENEIVYTVVADLESGYVESLGDIDDLDYSSIANNLFGDKQSVENLFNSLKGQILPRTWRQGKVSAVICHPTDNIIVGLFYHDNSDDPIVKFRFAKSLNSMIENIW